MGKNINVILSLKDRFSSPIKQAANSTKEMEKRVKQSTKSIERFGKQANNSFKSIIGNGAKAALAMAGIGGALSLAGLKAYASESVELAKAQLEAETKLEAVLQNVKSIQAQGPEYYKQAAAELKGVASGIQNVGVIGDEVTLAGMQQLATFQLSEKEIGTLSAGMTDLLAQQKGLNASQGDAVTIGNMIGKAMMGNVGALSRVGISFDEAQEKAIKLGNSTQRAATIAEVLKDNVGGVNGALAQTDQGKIQQMKNAYGDMREEIGKKLLPIQAKMAGWFFIQIPAMQGKLLGFIDGIVGKAQELVNYLRSIYPKIQPTLLKIKDGATYAFKAIGMAVKLAMDHLDLLLPVLIGVVSGFAAFNILVKVAGVLTLATKAVKGFKAGLLALKVVMIANPLAVAAIAIGALVTAFLIAYNRSEKFRNMVNQLWVKIQEFGAGLQAKVSPALQRFAGYFQSDILPVLQNMKTLILLLWNNVLKPFGQFLATEFLGGFQSTFPIIQMIVSGAVGFIGGAIKTAITLLKSVTDFLIGVFTGDWAKAWEGIKGITSTIWNAITGTITGAIDKIAGGIGIIKDKIMELLGLGGKTIAVRSVVKGQNVTMPGHATGTPYFAGGNTRVNEGGRGEVVNLPGGSQIVPHDVSKKAIGGGSSKNVNVYFTGPFIGTEDFKNETASFIMQKVLSAMSNS